MKTLLRILLVLVVLVAIAAVVGMFMSPQFHVERSMVMKAPAPSVYNQINDLKNWDNWMPWNKMDPSMKKDFGSITAGEGASYSWQSEHREVGNGTITIMKSVPDEYVETQLTMEGMQPAKGAYKIENTDGGTRVTWSMDGNMGSNPFMKLMASMMGKMVGEKFDEGLKSLDSAAVVQPAPAPVAMADTMTQATPDTVTAH